MGTIAIDTIKGLYQYLLRGGGGGYSHKWPIWVCAAPNPLLFTLTRSLNPHLFVPVRSKSTQNLQGLVRSPAAILDDRKSLLNAFLAISDQYANFFFFFFFKMAGLTNSSYGDGRPYTTHLNSLETFSGFNRIKSFLAHLISAVTYLRI